MNGGSSTFLQLDPADNVSVALTNSDGITAGHNKASITILAGEAVRKFNQIIGFPSVDIALSVTCRLRCSAAVRMVIPGFPQIRPWVPLSISRSAMAVPQFYPKHPKFMALSTC